LKYQEFVGQDAFLLKIPRTIRVERRMYL